MNRSTNRSTSRGFTAHRLTVPLKNEPRTLSLTSTAVAVLVLHGIGFSFTLDPAIVLSILQLEIAIFFLIMILTRAWLRPVWRLDETGLAVEDRFSHRTLSWTRIVRLGHVRIVHWFHVLSIESPDERLTLHWVGKELPPEVEAFLEALARRSGQRRRGAASSTIPENARYIINAIEQAADARRFAKIRWVIQHLEQLRFAQIGLQNPLLSMANLLYLGGHFLFYGALGITVAFLLDDERKYWVITAMVCLIFSKWSIVMGVNLALLSFDREVRAKEGIESELEAARAVQQRLLPAGDPELPGLDIHGDCEPAREVGGDYFDIFAFEDRTVIAIADIAGKGLAAGLLMTLVKGTLGTLLSRGIDLREAALAVGEQIRRSRRERRFVTLVLVEIDLGAGVLRLLRAGHNPPLLLSRGETRRLEPPGVALGLGRDGRFEETCEIEEMPFDADDVLVLYTDGVTEALDARGEEFGEERLRMCAAENAARSAVELHRALIEKLDTFRGGAPASDDVTVVVARRVTD